MRDAVAAMRDGAVNYLAKPIDLDELLASVRTATGIAETAPPLYDDEKKLPDYVIARSPLMQAVFHDASLIAPSETRVLITGESGVGKEILADVIHAWSLRAARPDDQSQLRRDSRNASGKRIVRPRNAARSPARAARASGVLKRRTAARFFSMRSPRCRRRCRRNYCA